MSSSGSGSSRRKATSSDRHFGSETYTYSDLDTERLDGTIYGQFSFTENLWLWGGPAGHEGLEA